MPISQPTLTMSNDMIAGNASGALYEDGSLACAVYTLCSSPTEPSSKSTYLERILLGLSSEPSTSCAKKYNSVR